MCEKYSLEALLSRNEYICNCGKMHKNTLKAAVIEKNALQKICGFIRDFEASCAYVVSDINTESAAGEAVKNLLIEGGIRYIDYVYPYKHFEPDERAVGAAFMHYSNECDIIIGVGSGVINDICKLLSATADKPYIIVATAPSMDGYASATSSMIRDGLKISLDSKCPEVIIGDLDILCSAPVKMICSGFGDMLAKYISICEWRIGNLVTGEYYCEEVASIVRYALKKCVESAKYIKNRDEDTVRNIMEGMIISGIAMNYAGISRPASGVEHYFSHIWDMRALEFSTPMDFHGIQCAIGTVLALKVYDRIKSVIPDRNKALKRAEAFSAEDHFEALRSFLGRGAQAMIDSQIKEDRYNQQKHLQRFEVIEKNWDKIIGIINEELPDTALLIDLLEEIGAPVSVCDIGLTEGETASAFLFTRDIRDKYILSSLLFDMGIDKETAEEVFG